MNAALSMSTQNRSEPTRPGKWLKSVVRPTSAQGTAMRHTSLDDTEPPTRTHLFTVRVWLEELGAGQTEWRGEVHYVLSGEVRYFRDWPMLIALVQTMLPKQAGADVP
jgi:hypothetical protein